MNLRQRKEDCDVLKVTKKSILRREMYGQRKNTKKGINGGKCAIPRREMYAVPFKDRWAWENEVHPGEKGAKKEHT